VSDALPLGSPVTVPGALRDTAGEREVEGQWEGEVLVLGDLRLLRVPGPVRDTLGLEVMEGV
jgi:hypothetical protein